MTRVLVLLTFAALSQDILACAVCGFGESSRTAFFSATLIMTLVPLTAIGGVFYLVYKKNFSTNSRLDNSDRNLPPGGLGDQQA